MRLRTSLLAMSLVASFPATGAVIYSNGSCCIAQAIFSDPDRSLLLADDVALGADVTIGGIRFFGVYADSGGAIATNSIPPDDAFTFRIFSDATGQPGTLIGTSTLSGSRTDTGETLGTTGLRWHRYDMNLDAPIALGPGIVWISVSNNTAADVDDDWAWGLTDNNPQLALSVDTGATWESEDRTGNLAFTLFDENGVTSLRLSHAVLDQSAQPASAAEIGDRLVYHVELSNDSGVTATNTVLENLLPEGVVLVDIAMTPSVAPTIVERSLRWDLAELPGVAPDNVFVADIAVDVASSAGGSNVVNAIGIVAVDEPFAAGVTASSAFDAIDTQLVTLDKRVLRAGRETGVADVGDRLTYVLTVTNLGATARDAVVTDVLPGTVAYAADSGGYDPGTGIWAVGTLGVSPPDNEATLTIDADVLAAAAADGAISNVAAVTSLDGLDANIPDYASVSLFGADLELEAVGVRDPDGAQIAEVPGGGNARFQFRLTNNGPDPTTGVAAVALLEIYDPSISFTGFATVYVYDSPDFSGDSREPTGASGSSCTVSRRVWTCPLERPGGRNTLNAGETISFEISINAPASQQEFALTLAAQAASATTDAVAGNSGAEHALSVLPAPPLTLDSGRSDSRCFIATAAYGSYLEPEVEVLRHFRDDHLLTNGPGRAFVTWYYAHSPPVAAFIVEHPLVRTATRWLLSPVVYAVKYPWAAGGLLGLAGLGGISVVRRRTVAVS